MIAIICHNHSGIDVEYANRCKMIRLWDLFYELWRHLSVPLSSLKSTKTLSDGDHLTVYNVTKYNKSLHACYILFGGYSTISPYSKKNPERPDIFYQMKKKVSKSCQLVEIPRTDICMDKAFGLFRNNTLISAQQQQHLFKV